MQSANVESTLIVHTVHACGMCMLGMCRSMCAQPVHTATQTTHEHKHIHKYLKYEVEIQVWCTAHSSIFIL